jgi:RNA polymerase sigma-70 factor, ECF subfamily
MALAPRYQGFFLNTGAAGTVIHNERGKRALELTRHFGELAAVREDEFAALVERQSRFVFRVAYAVVRNAADAEDVTQDVFLKLHRTGAWRGMLDERAFLARAAWRLAVERRKPARVLAPLPVVESCEGDLVQRDLQAVVHRLMDALPEELRAPLALSAVEEMSSREIALVLGIPEGTVRTRLMRARGVLREKLAAKWGGRR